MCPPQSEPLPDEDDDDITVVTSNTTLSVKTRKIRQDVVDRPQYHDLFIALPDSSVDHSCNAVSKIAIPEGWGLCDSGASNIYLTPSDAQRYATNVQPTSSPIHVNLPDGNIASSSHTCTLDYPALPPAVTTGHVLPGLAHFSLVPVNNFAQAGCKIIFDDSAVRIYHKGKCIIQGCRHPTTGLWIVPLSQAIAQQQQLPTTPSAHLDLASSAYTMPTKQQATSYMHQCLSSPPISSLLQASRSGFLESFPHLSPRDITTYLAPSPATPKGHLRRQRKHHRTTHPRARPSPSPVQQSTQECNMFCLAVLADLHKGTIYNDNTGKFPVQSLDGHQFFFVTYVYDLNVILARPLKNQQSDTIIAMYKEIFAFLQEKGFTPKFNVCDNQASAAIKAFLHTQQCDGQFVIPADHRVLAAERAIQCWKNHFISTLCTTDSKFPLQLWHHLAPQAEDTLNLLRPSRSDPTKSAYEALYGAPYDFNRHPLAPPGTKAVVYEPADSRSSWGPRGVDGWYLGSAKDHYRGYIFYVPETKRTRIANTAEFFPQHCRFRQVHPSTHAKLVAEELCQAFKQLQPSQRNRLLNHLQRQLSSPPSPPPSSPPVQRVDPSVPSTASLERVSLPSIPPQPEQRVDNTPCPTSDTQPEQRVETNNPNSTTQLPQSPSVFVPYNLRSKSIGRGNSPSRYSPTGMSRRRLQGLLDYQLEQDQTPTPPRITDSPPIPTSTNPTHPSVHKTAPRVHSRVTRRNVPSTVPPITSPVSPPVRRSPRLNPHLGSIIEETTSREFIGVRPNLISNAAINAITAKVYYSEDSTWVPTTLQRLPVSDPLPDLQQFAAPVVHPVTGETITSYKKLMNDSVLGETWRRGLGKEFGNLCQGDDLTGEKGTNALHVMSHEEITNIPADRVVTYARIVVDYRPQKDDPNRVRITAGGNLITTPEEVTTRTADLVTTKILWNSVLSTPDAKYACFDIKSFFLTAPLDRYEYMKMPIDVFPEHTIAQYNLRDKVKGGFVYLECRRCIYGLPQSGALANRLLRERLMPAGYYEVPHTPGLWKHVSRPIQFSLIVDDFGVKYVGEEHAQHLLNHLKQTYTVSEDWTGSLYAGIDLEWDYTNRTLRISMPKYIPKLLQRYEHETPPSAQHSPHKAPPRAYGKAAQTPVPHDDSQLLPTDRRRRVQAVIGSVLFYARAVDNTVLVALSSMAMSQAKATEDTEKHVQQLLDYLATYPNASVLYRASDMVLNIHSDASYLNEPHGRSRVAGFYFLGSTADSTKPIQLNGAIHVACSVIKFTVASAAEAELGALFLNCREGKIIRLTLEELGHPQPATPVHCDNATAVGIANDTIKKQRSRAMEMRFFWVTDQVQRKLFDILWYPGKENLADYFTKHFTAPHHRAVRPYYLAMPNSPKFLPRAATPKELRGCVGELQYGYTRDNPLPRVPLT